MLVTGMPSAKKRLKLDVVQEVTLDFLSTHEVEPKSDAERETLDSLVRLELAEKDPTTGKYRSAWKGENERFKILKRQDKVGVHPGGRPSTLKGSWGKLADAYGGPGALAKRCRCHYQSIYRWALKGEKPSGMASAIIAELAASAGVPNPLEDGMTRDENTAIRTPSKVPEIK